MRSPLLVLVVIAGATVVSPLATSGSEPVSPGRIDRESRIHAPCPTFSWTVDSEAHGYEIAVQRLSQNLAATESPHLVLRQVLPAGAASWTPDGDHCLEPGGHYAWTVRRAGPDDDTPWSQPRFFSVIDTPSLQEVSQALEVLRRYLDRDAPSESRAPTPEPQPIRDASVDRDLGLGALDFDSARAALRGELPETVGETFGVAGRTNSPDGAGIAAANADPGGGADLLLDGSAQGIAHTILTESGLDRASASNQTFTFGNSGAGTLNLAVAGNLSTTDLTVNGVVTANGLASLDGGIDVDGLFTVDEITGDVETQGQFTVAGVANLESGANVTGDLSIDPGDGGTNELFINESSLSLGGETGDALTVIATIQGTLPFVFEGGTSDGFQTTFAITDPTADRTITFADASGTVVVSESSAQLASAILTSFVRLTPVADASGSSPAACAGGTTGTIYYDSEENLPCFCDGTNYVYVADAVTSCTP